VKRRRKIVEANRARIEDREREEKAMTALTEQKKYAREYLALKAAESKAVLERRNRHAMSGAKVDRKQIVRITEFLGAKVRGRCRIFSSEMKV